MAQSKRYSFKDFMRGLLVHESISGDTSQLDAEIIPNNLKSALSGVAPVSPSATIATIRPNNKWVIQNGAKKLIVRKDKESHGPAMLRVYCEDFTLETDLIPGVEIKGTCFYRESLLGETGDPYKEIFPPTMTGVTFNRCNLDNIFVPLGNTIINDGGHRRIRVQNDLKDWLVDASGNPIEPLSPNKFDELGLSKDPKDIPASPVGVNP